MHTTEEDHQRFARAILQKYPLDEALEFVRTQISIDDIYDPDEIFKWVAKNYDPQDVFSDDQLRKWAKDNDLVEAPSE